MQARSLAAQAGFTGHGLDVIVAIAHAESSLNPKNCNVNSDSRRTLDRGILQINNYWHSEVTDACAFDPQCAFEQGYRISSHGTHFTRVWSTYDSGAYRRYMP
ncbi:transglycosylase SLT domain-containing protein [Ktedonospora formicarum]|uniref:transglycosylase SLT domain-containing protein n=1 Tax=Ktedonospora formicarum TaxID=2778364 RepID=UPI001C68E464